MAEGVIDHPSETTEILIVIVTEIDVDLEAAVEEEIETIVSTTEKITEMVKVKKTMALMLLDANCPVLILQRVVPHDSFSREICKAYSFFYKLNK